MATLSSSLEFLRLGAEHHKQGRLDQAELLYRRALQSDPDSADGLHLLGVIAHQRGDHETAIRSICRAIKLDPRPAAYFSNLGIAYRSLGKSAEAVEALREAAARAPASAGIHYNLANALKDSGQWREAAAAFRKSLEIDPANADAWTGLGDAQRNLRDFSTSLISHHTALRHQPRSAEAFYNLGLTWRDEENLEEAADCFLKATCLQTDFVDAHFNLACVHDDLGAFPRARAAYDRALRLNPHHAAARFNRALTYLKSGNLVIGWKEYEARWRHNGKRRRFTEPEWDGSYQAGQRLLIYSEQGIGDEILFASCFKEALSRCGAGLIECDGRLVPLFSRSFPTATVFPRSGEIDPAAIREMPRWHVQIAAGSLPHRLRPTFDSFPRHAGYLVPEPGRVEKWQARYAELRAGLVVGISWRGGKDPAVRRRRSTELLQWKSLFEIPGVAFVNLQYGDCRAEVDACQDELKAPLYHWNDSDPLTDLDDFAAQIAALDLVISVDNSTVHLAGALNRPVWTLLPAAADWRWFTERQDSPWYPSMRLFRQLAQPNSSTGRWEELFSRVANTLQELAATRANQYTAQGAELHATGQLPQAIDAYERALTLRPNDGRILNDLGATWKACSRHDRAIDCYERSIACDPQNPAAWFNLGNVYREECRLDEAAACYRKAESSTPGDHRVLVNLSVCLREARRLDESLDCLERVLERQPELAEARFDRSLVNLLRGNLSAGWDEYDWRLKDGTETRVLPASRWDGSPLQGRSILILSEQGIGDQIMFASCLREIARSARGCHIECDPRLAPLYERSFPGIVTHAPSSEETAPTLERFDVVEYIGSLPRFLRRNLSDFPSSAGYLVPNPNSVAKWKARFAAWGRCLKVGIAWRGGKDAETQRKRSLPIEEWEPIFAVPGIRFVNLQHGSAAAEGAIARERFGVAFDDGTDCDPIRDLDEFAAKIAALDLILSVDNSTVHLAGAIGRPVWTLLPFSADWRWMLEGETTPWYSTMRLFRSARPDAWTDAVRRAARALAAAAFR